MKLFRYLLAPLLLFIFPPLPLWASYFASAEAINISYRLGDLQIPATTGATTDWTTNGAMPYTVVSDNNAESFLDLTMGGHVLGDGVTWITSNAGVGVQFKLTDVNGCLAEATQPPYYMSLPANTSCLSSSLQISYRLVRLADVVPAGKIDMPNVQVSFANYSGAPVANFVSMFYSGGSDQPQIIPCDIDVPGEVRLDDLQSGEIAAGTLKMKNVPVTFRNCPGAISNIRYAFTSAYGPQDAAYGTINTSPGSAANIYFQLLRASGDPYHIAEYYDLEGYTGSGEYSVPFNVAYFVASPEQVALGDVDSLVTLTVNYQ